MTTVQIIGVAVAALAVLLVVIAFVVTRRDGGDSGEAAVASPPEHRSFMEEAPHDTLARLGKAERPVEDVTLDPAVERAASERAAEFARRERCPHPGGLGLEWFPDLTVRTTAAASAAAGAAVLDKLASDDPESTDELWSPNVAEQPAEVEPCECAPGVPEFHNPWEPEEEDAETPEAGDRQPAEPTAAGEAHSGGDGTEAPGSAGPEDPEAGANRLVPLSEVIVTTSDKMVDLEDQDVRRMLTELVTFEIDQATEYRRLGQTIDAVLQLTEAEKVSRALGMYESAQRIRAMMEEFRS